MARLNKRQKELIERTQKYYDNLRTKRDKEKHKKLLITNYLNSTDDFFIKSYEAFAETNNIELPKKP